MCFQYQMFYFCYCIFQFGYYCMINNGMIDIQFMYFRDGGNGFYVVIGQIVFGVNFQIEVCGKGCGFGDMCQFLCLFGVSFGISIVIGVDLDKWCVNFCCSFDLFFIGVNKQRNLNFGICQMFVGIVYFVMLFCDIQVVFGCYFLMFFWYQVVKMWFCFNGDCQYFFGYCYFQIYVGIQCLMQDVYVVVSNVMVIFM